jgi:hypothetical protein
LYDAALLDFLIRCHWLSEADAGDARKVGDAITRMLEDAAQRPMTRGRVLKLLHNLEGLFVGS